MLSPMLGKWTNRIRFLAIKGKHQVNTQVIISSNRLIPNGNRSVCLDTNGTEARMSRGLDGEPIDSKRYPPCMLI